MKKTFLIIFICVTSVTLFQAFTTPHEPRFKNLQILPKDISDHGLDSIMHHFTGALGVKCNFCHVRNEAERKMDFASDDKPEKNIARKMMLMAIDINRNYFKNMEPHDMDHDHDSTKNEDHDVNKNEDHDHDAMDTTNMQPYQFMLRTVTCFTCHRGDPHPETKIPPRPEVQKQSPPPPTGDNK
ncbi:MAG: c-type cytochrome [Ginsengibacter sp.]